MLLTLLLPITLLAMNGVCFRYPDPSKNARMSLLLHYIPPPQDYYQSETKPVDKKTEDESTYNVEQNLKHDTSKDTIVRPVISQEQNGGKICKCYCNPIKEVPPSYKHPFTAGSNFDGPYQDTEIAQSPYLQRGIHLGQPTFPNGQPTFLPEQHSFPNFQSLPQQQQTDFYDEQSRYQGQPNFPSEQPSFPPRPFPQGQNFGYPLRPPTFSQGQNSDFPLSPPDFPQTQTSPNFPQSQNNFANEQPPLPFGSATPLENLPITQTPLDAIYEAEGNSDNLPSNPASEGIYNKEQTKRPVDANSSNEYSSESFPSTSSSDQNDMDCTCVPYYQCANGSIVTDGTDLLDIRFQHSVQQACDDYLAVCCKKPLDESQAQRPSPTPRKGCGSRHPNGLGFRITGAINNETQFGEFPWMMAILKISMKYQNTFEYQCGGALIHERVVLTAAHCVKARTPEELKVRGGEWDTMRVSEPFPHKDVGVSNIVVHPEYSSGSLWNDFALVFLNESFPLGNNIDTVCLPPPGKVPQHRECFASGWGKDNFDAEGRYQVILKKIDLPIVEHQLCESSLRNTRLGPSFNLHESFVCAGGIPGKDTCKGDGGSPLSCPIEGNPDMYEVTGLVAWGIGCGGETPGVYANVAYARDWIDQTLKIFNIQLET